MGKQNKQMRISYQRVSTELQANGIDAQTNEIKRYCEYKNIQLDKSFVDFGISGKNFNREQFQEMIELVKQGLVDEIIITELARWGRNMLEALQNINILKKHKCNLVVLKENIDLNSASGNLLTNILFSLAEWERQECKIRTAKVLQDLKANNKQYTKSVYGYDMVNGDMIENPTEIRMLKKVAKLKSNGKSYQEITDFLNRNGYVRKNKTIWNRNSIIKLIKTRIKNDNSISINQ
jgi:site-specific DNA recombinase|tara:strand:- start:797 stop:1504 length:708 start_codon:yes stop_codon:yes gene_type:complete